MVNGKNITNASTRFATFGILGFFEFTVLSGKFRLNLHGSKRVMQALENKAEYGTQKAALCPSISSFQIRSRKEKTNPYI
ncbi:hypothetical protein CXF74_20970 [Psychromonas sp. Urea-02u-13]|nr:hypothetical protein CXF74_20970 [Psychromonas sp. Urea-02u-13]